MSGIDLDAFLKKIAQECKDTLINIINTDVEVDTIRLTDSYQDCKKATDAILKFLNEKYLQLEEFDTIIEHEKLKNDKNEQKTRRQHDDGFDLAILETLYHASDAKIIGLSELDIVASAYDPLSTRTTLNSKLTRWKKEDKLVEWAESKRRYLTDNGRKKRTALLSTVDQTRKSKIRDILRQKLNITASC